MFTVVPEQGWGSYEQKLGPHCDTSTCPLIGMSNVPSACTLVKIFWVAAVKPSTVLPLILMSSVLCITRKFL